MPKISLSTWSFFLTMDYQQAMQFAVDHGFQGIEIWSSDFDFLPGKITTKEINAIRSISRKNNILLAIHFCLTNNLADINKGHLKESMKQLKETIRLCHEIGAGIAVIHPGMIPHMYAGMVPDMSIHCKSPSTHYKPPTLTTLKQDALVRFKKSLEDAVSFAEKNHVVIALENCGHLGNCVQSSFEDLVEWVDEIGNPALQITLDVGHANLEGDVQKAIEIFGPRIKHVHLNDNNGISSNHGELGTGTIDWNAITPFLKSFNGMLSLEILAFDDAEGAVLRSKSFLENLLKEN